ncbi:phage tail protein [Photorhabdus sp. P32]|uniref:tail fiber protein n=1 Tax=Photorhabdus sp. P32 TaxID=3117549 RepID=UPI00311ADFC0
MELAKSAVPSSRKINGKALSGDISLSAGDVGAFRLRLTGTYSVNNQVPWNVDTGLYDLRRPGDSQLVAHFCNGIGSCPAFQLKVHYRNGGIAYRSARDSYGFEEDWTDIYTTRKKPSPGEIGAYTTGECDNRYALKNAVGVINLRLGSWVTEGGWTNETKDWSAPSGHVLVGLGTVMWSSGRQHLASVHYRPVQAYINGIWVTISSI